ncbi:DUF2092 domain-containing protein [Pseudovibrio flavus]|uniref:DUF2092 domain-containing protein n=1 Tax=Pseudovibrio flavus TaxID=2529854 RepID=UPI00211C6BE2|nr:DUF2092 domain-containing protein [Pseudovibrio flavus]
MMSWIKAGVSALLLCFILSLPFAGANANPTIQRQDEKALKMLSDLLELFRNTEKMQFTVNASEERVFKDLVPLNFTYQYSVKLEGEDKIKIELPRVNGLSQLFYFDGIMSYYDVTRNLYTEGDFTGDSGSLVKVLRDEFQLSFPGLDIINRNLSNTINNWTNTALYVGRELLPEGVAHHLAFFSQDIDWQIWIYEDTGLPGYLILSYKLLDGLPQTHVRYSGWNLKPTFKDNEFRFDPPAGASQFALPDFGKKVRGTQQ